MKKRITLWLLLAALALCGCCAAEEGFVTAADNGFLRLLVNEETLAMRVEDLTHGAVYETKAMEGKNGNKTTKNNQKSDVRVYYVVNEFVGTTASMDSYSMSVEYGNYELEYLENGVEIHYTIGDKTITMDDLPKMVPLEKYYSMLLPNWADKDDKAFREFYRVYRDTMWVRTDDGNIGKVKLNNLYTLFYEKGTYTREDLEEDNAAYGYEISKINPSVSLSVRFVLDGQDLLVSVPCGEITFTNGNPVTRIDLLPYFLSAGTEDQGYIFVPDGCGSLINLNNGKLTALSYNDRVYGNDVLTNVSTYTPPSEPIRLPVYGMKTQHGATLAIIEEGAALAGIVSDVSGRSDEFNTVYSYFMLRDIELLSVLGTASGGSPRYPTDVYEGDITVRYRFLYEEEANYTGMARAYREYLTERGMLREREMPEEAPFFAEIIGGVRETRFFAGVPYESTAVATTLAQGGEILSALQDAGVRNPVLLLKGFLRGGVKHESLSVLNLEGSTGNAAQLKTLREAAEAAGGETALVINAEKVYTTRHFAKASQASRRQDDYVARVVTYAEPILAEARGYEESFYVTPACLEEYSRKVSENLKKTALPVDSLAVDDLGWLLVGDYRNRKNISRIHALPRAEGALEELNEKPLILRAPNDYALRFAEAVYDLPEKGNGFKVTDADIPFLQMVLEGSAVCCGKAWNESAYNGVWRQLNRAVEAKCAPHFVLTVQDETVFMHTEDNDTQSYFMTQYRQWMTEIETAYARYNDFWHKVSGARIREHALLGENLRRVTYDNGVSVYVNYGAQEAETDGVTIPARDFVITEGKR